MTHILAIDQGTTSSRAIVFDAQMAVVAVAQQEFPQQFPRDGWVEHGPDDLWRGTLATCRQAIEKARISVGEIAGIGITNQRETTLIWDRKTGRPIHNAIVWQDRRTAATCQALRQAGHGEMVRARTGLELDPYFSATKAAWMLDHVEGARARAAAGDLAFGTVDTWLIWNLTDGREHATDATNASRTMLYNIKENQWDEELCALFDVPLCMLPEVHDCAADFGETDADLFNAALPIYGVAGDQQAAAIGQACFSPGMMKSTYGTGCFALLNTGNTLISSKNRLLTTIAYQFDGVPGYALEGAIFNAGTVVQWLRDGLRMIERADQSGPLAGSADPDAQVVFVPAFTGLGAPWWDAECRGAIYGLTRDTGPAEIARAALEGVVYQTFDLYQAMLSDWGDSGDQAVLRVDGGMAESDFTMQLLADILDAPVDRPTMTETTALGAAWLAGMRAGVYPDQAGFAAKWARDRRFAPCMAPARRDIKIARWKDAIQRTLSKK